MKSSQKPFCSSIFLFCLLVAVASLSTQTLAGIGWYVTIYNESSSDLNISSAGNDNWYCNDFCGPKTVKAGQSHTFYTEVHGEDTAIQGINMNGVHVEFYTSGHAHTGTEIVSKTLYAPHCVVDEGCHCGEEGPTAISTSNTQAISATLDSGSDSSCPGSFGTVQAGVHYHP